MGKCTYIDETGNRCKTWPTYNNEGETKALYCVKHKKDGMTNVVSKTCIYEGCKIRPSYNTEGKTKALYCKEHKTSEMVNVKSKPCIHEENGIRCKILPTYNIDGETGGLYCGKHKLDGMVDVINKTCVHEGCKTRPTFNNEGEKKAMYCVEHKLDGMINVSDRRCIYEGCSKQPCYNIEGETKALYCYIHKLEGMVDVKNKTCVILGCKTRPTFNKEGETKGLYCSYHKLDGMTNVVSKTCIYEENGIRCKTRPNYNIDGETGGLYCNKHKLDGMVDIKHNTCKSEWCDTRATDKYDGYCMYCYTNLFPDKPVSRNYKTKERSVVEFVTTKFPDFTWVADKHVNGGCSKRRPDLLLDLGDQIIIVEIDENQHTDYDCSCENKRIMELSQDVGHRPIVFIRFNPDDYTHENGNKISSCWAQDGNGICVIKKSKKIEWETRLQQLNDQIQYWSNTSHRTNKTVEVVQLFYDMNLDEDEDEDEDE